MKKSVLFILALLVAFNINAQLDRSTPPKPGPAPKVNIGKAQTFELKNGLKVFVVENDKVPVVSYTLSLDIDPLIEGEKAGYSSIAGDLMGSGTSTRSKAQIDEAVDFIGATLNTSSKGMYASSLKKHSDELLNLMTDVLYNPSFPAEELEKAQKQMLTGLKSQKDDPKAIASNIKSVLRFGKDHPYGEILTEASVEAITVDDLKSYYNTYFRPNVAYLVIVGDISVKEAKKQAKKYFAQWESKEVPTYKYDFPAGFETPKVVVANKDGSTQSTISLSYNVDLKPGHPDAIKARVMNSILGGGSFSARLFQNLREDKAFTYGAYSSLSSDELVGTFNAGANVRTSVTDSAFTEIIYEMERMRTELVDEAGLQMVKNSLTGSFSRSLEDPATVARFALNIEKYNLPADYYETYLEKLNAVSTADIKAMAEKYLTPDNALILAVGDVPNMRASLKKFAKDGKVEMYDFYGNVVKAMPLPADLTAEKVIIKYINAIGGTEAIAAVDNYILEGTMNVQGMPLSMKMYSRRPNHQCVETYMQGNLVSKQVFNGEAGKVVSPMGEQKIEGEMLENMKAESVMFPETQYAELGYKLELLGADNVDGQDVVKLKVISPSGKEQTVFYSRNTGLKVKEVSTSPQGTMASTYTEYAEVNGIKFPKKMSQAVGPQSFDITFESIKVNEGIDASKFDI
ncbi:insulinase family protein [Carboxylicivirga mesophila]|uniref:Insulinase family protein n=1 Tax=Carboxylicivirga mesophila TaxID=1166478 RepID=A0ABS5K422_9BACT|nr:insulinase family protein [Carboxylicivirga mesophila]MBS2209789.1 insulinase family protein [Carboxylicivirga mesophila]